MMLAVIVAFAVIFFVTLALAGRGLLPFYRYPPIALNPDVYQSFKLVKKTRVTHDSFIFRFALHASHQCLGLPTGHHIRFRVASKHNFTGTPQVVQHSYTPISSNDDKGFVDFLVKIYYKGSNPAFPNGGRLSQHLDSLSIGEAVEMLGPVGKFQYMGNGDYTVEMGKGEVKRQHVAGFAMVAGGTGITPMMQIIHAILKSPEDPTRLWLVYSNHTEEDILLRDALAEACKDPRVKVWHTLTRSAPPDWAYGRGRVNEEMLRTHLPPPQLEEGSVTVLLCGPPLMLQDAVKPNLLNIGYSQDNIFTF
ncbi:NADH-cytochrome b5 reductase, putative [Trypanosoma brucei brucei TREU927]|uniref:NADH-cytochrome b5 reductase n=1 Tax=Trypanosoma brucei brucei (strain 927/4 GUTat10.1) TaxID=185431 RepID=Q386D7_TRYB2|nr:NADH-cytochrome b5 reductase, putative [Trypanosoma brucei brucei TREU927]EAN79344.1 NADH-cytochrome b5 reductase, putative [Trypanosoma brucei brucei TREU927]